MSCADFFAILWRIFRYLCPNPSYFFRPCVIHVTGCPAMIKRLKYLLAFTWLLFGFSYPSMAQYFGRNKPIYKNIKFDVYQTPNFLIYHYFDNDSLLNVVAQSAEKWYGRHYQIFGDSIRQLNPILVYNNHADFQQTTAIQNAVGIGTGGVTEALKNRVIFPLTETWQQTNHVLGHELVHAFQYNLLFGSDSLNINNIQTIPLWMIEGMAEYLSIGTSDYQTAMWMRDAVLNDNFPTLQQMTAEMYKYFPYRWGHAFWSFVGKTFGDSLIRPIFLETAFHGYDYALRKHLGLDAESFSTLWKSIYTEYFRGIMPSLDDNPPGSPILFERNAGEMNISPSVSPDGRYVAFFSEMDLFSTDLFVAHTLSGKVVRRLSKIVHDNEIDALNFTESAGAWSPDSRYFAFVAFSKGINKIIVVDVYDSRQTNEFAIPGVPYFNYPTWSPDGQSIVVSGIVEGVNDLYAYNLHTRQTTRLTHDGWCNIHPSYSPDGQHIVFATDRPANFDTTHLACNGYNLATLDMNNGNILVYNVFPTAENLNPMFSGDNRHIYFLSNSDGYRNLYRFDTQSYRTVRLTQILTGICGLTPLAPAMSVAHENDEICYSYYDNGKYSIFAVDTVELSPVEVDPQAVNYAAAILPPINVATPGIVDKNLADNNLSNISVDSFKTIPFKRNFKLDYISNVGMGVSTNQFGTGLAGGIEMLFSDITGADMLYTALALNGEIYDFGGQFSFMRKKKYMVLGAGISHIPLSMAFYGFDTLTQKIDEKDVKLFDYQTLQYRRFQTSGVLMAYFPLSKTQRIEFSAAISHYSYRVDIYSSYYLENGIFYGSDKHKAKQVPASFWLQHTNLAYVYDDSDFGLASPMRGARVWMSAEQALLAYKYVSVVADLRKYFFIRPFSVALRCMYQGRYGNSVVEDELYPLYLGYPWYVRGYETNRFEEYDPSGRTNLNQLYGNQMALASIEFRIPFTGPKRLAVLKSNTLFTELALFVDAGLAWTNDNGPTFLWHPENKDQHIPFVSSGISLRINLFGMIVLEPYIAAPFQIGGFKALNWGFNFMPGW